MKKLCKQKKQNTKKYNLYDSIYMKFKNKEKVSMGDGHQNGGYFWETAIV